METIRVINFTLHRQSEETKQLLAKYFEDFGEVEITSPKAPTIGPLDNMRTIQGTVETILFNSMGQAEKEVLLVGGQTATMFSAIKYAKNKGLPVIEITTRRTRDEDDRFVFIPLGIREIVPLEIWDYPET